MASVVSKTGVWNVQAGEKNTPDLVLSEVQAGTIIKLTCQFYARTLSDDLGDGFQYSIVASDVQNCAALTPANGFVQDSDSWQMFTHVVLLEVLPPLRDSEVTFNLEISSGDMNGRGAMMNYMLLAEDISLGN